MLNETTNILNDLNLYGLKNSISNEIDYITNNNLSFLEGLNHFLKSEVKYREINRAEANIKVAHFPYLKEIKDTTKLPIITNYSTIKNNMLSLEFRTTCVYASILNETEKQSLIESEYKDFPIIK